MAKNIQITVIYGIGDNVCLKSDPENYKYIVINWVIDKYCVMYQVRGIAGVFTLYDYELWTYEQAIVNFN